MTKSIQVFMKKLIDYAGLFPPAELNMLDAVSEYFEFINGTDSWMMSHFICPATRLTEFESVFLKLTEIKKPWNISIIVGSASTIQEYLKDYRRDVLKINEFREKLKGKVIVDFIETRMPAEVLQNMSQDTINFFLNSIIEIQKEGQLNLNKLFFEPVWDDNWQSNIPKLIEFLSNIQSTGMIENNLVRNIGFKLRCGGVDASAFPTPEKVSKVIFECNRGNLSFKATAGLHHPIRHYNPGVETTMHGFFNVFGALLLAGKHRLNVDQIKLIIADEDSKHFLWDDHFFRWGDWQINIAEMEELRTGKAISYGSCSFDEPREDLKKLQLL